MGAEKQSLEESIAEQREECRSELFALQGERERLRIQLRDRRVEVDIALDHFAAEQSAKVAEHKRSEEAELRRLEELWQQKAAILEKEMKLNENRLAKAIEAIQQREEVELQDLRQGFRQRYRLRNARCCRMVENEHQATTEQAERAGK